MADMKEFVQMVKVTGVDEAVRQLKELGVNTAELGKETEEAGEKSEKASQKFGGMGGMVDGLGAAGKRMIAAYSGLGAIVDLFRDLQDILAKSVELQNELAGKAVDLAGGSKFLARQLGVTDDKAAGILTQIRIAGGLDAASASSIGIAADIAFADQGGLLAGQNFLSTRELAAFGGSNAMTSTEVGSLLGFLKAAGALRSPESAKLATSQIAAAARASRSKSIGAFVAQLERGGTGLLQQGLPLADVLELGGQARQVEVSEDLAAQTLITLEQLAVAGAEDKFNREMARVAQERGLDPKTLTSVQKIGLTRDIFGAIDSQAEQDRIAKLVSPERFLRLSKAFRASNVTATEVIGQRVAAASLAQFERDIEYGQAEISFRDEANKAAIDFSAYQTGRESFTISQARERAKAILDEQIAKGIVYIKDEVREAEEEKIVLELLQSRIDKLRREGADVTEAQKAADEIGWSIPSVNIPGQIPFISGAWNFGYRDSRLSRIAAATDEAQRQLLGAHEAERRANVTIINNVTNIGTQYQDVEAGRFPTPPPYDWNQ
jgi:hypothetical protein